MFTLNIFIKNRGESIEQHGNWIDLKSNEDVFLPPFDPSTSVDTLSKLAKREILPIESTGFWLINLGISIKMPKYFEMNIVPRSSLFIKKGIIQANHYGIVDNTYSGELDIVKFPAIALIETSISKGERICQMSIRPSMDAPTRVKLKWLLTSKIKFTEIEVMGSPNRGGFGSTGL